MSRVCEQTIVANYNFKMMARNLNPASNMGHLSIYISMHEQRK